MVSLIGLPVGTYGGITVSLSPLQRFKTGSRRRGKKSLLQVEQEYLDDALAQFSGYIAIDELYDGPFCVLSIVDNRTYRRLFHRVLDHSPKSGDISRFLKAFKKQLNQRHLKVSGITTDGSHLYPSPLALVFNGVPHQVCSFHVIKELTQSILHALAKVRKQMKAKLPPLPRGRPKKGRRRQTQRILREQQRINDLFDNRYLFVTHHLTPCQQQTLQRITRGLPQLRLLREIMDEVYRLFDRRCRTDTALDKLARLRRRVRRFKEVGKTLAKLFSPTLEKALTFLDDKLLPATSNAVERGNRRHRKMQKTVYRVRTRQSLQHRMALDLLREMHAADRHRTKKALHQARSPSRFHAEVEVVSVSVL
jgi:Transposase